VEFDALAVSIEERRWRRWSA